MANSSNSKKRRGNPSSGASSGASGPSGRTAGAASGGGSVGKSGGTDAGMRGGTAGDVDAGTFGGMAGGTAGGKADGTFSGKAYGASGDATDNLGRFSGLRRILFTLSGLFVLFLIWLFRPGDPMPEITLPPAFPQPGFTVESAHEAVRQRELASGPLRPDNHARIIWNNEYRDRQAPCSIVYIHGFTASYGEGDPVHARLARDLGCHLYVSRLHGHGLRTGDPLGDMQPDSLMADAAHALAIGGLLGEKVVLAGNSMGGILSLYLASAFPDRVDALLLFAPLLDFATPGARFFNRAWTQRIAELVMGGPYLTFEPANDGHARYWYTHYRMEAVGILESMRHDLISDTLYASITHPVFTGYYYKDEDNRDEVVSLSAILEFKDKLGTPPDQREFHAFPNAGAHVITSAYRSEEYDKVRHEAARFLREQLFD